MGIIRALKAYARHEIHCRIIEKIDDSVEGDTKIANEIAKEIVARYTAQSEIVESEDQDEEEPEEPNPVPIPQNADMRKMLNQLRIGLETKGFSSMVEFDTFAGRICDFLRKDLVHRNITKFFAPKTS